MGIYTITNLINGKFYLGSSNNLRLRKMRHFRQLNKGTHHSVHLQRAFDKYGSENFEFKILELVEEDKLLEVEQKYLDSLRPFDGKNGYNMSEGATNCILTGINHWTYGVPTEQQTWFGKKHTEETKNKIRQAQIGPLNHAFGKPSALKGIPHTDEHIRRNRESHKGQLAWNKGKTGIYSKESLEKMRIAATGRSVSDKVIHKSKEWIENISKGKKGKRRGSENPNSRRVIQFSVELEAIEEFDSVGDAHRSTGASLNGIFDVCKGRSKTAGGYKWMYLDEYNKSALIV